MSDQGLLKIPTHQKATAGSPKIRGLLIFIAFGLLLSLLQNFTAMLGGIAPLLGHRLWGKYTDPLSPDYHPLWKTVILYDAISGLFTFIISAVLVVLFFRKKRLFPKLTAITLPLLFIMSYLSYFLGGKIPAVAMQPEHIRSGRDLVIRFIAFHLWIPYLLLSNRVRQTFIR